MGESHKVLFHVEFYAACQKLVETKPKVEEPLATALDKIIEDPVCGKPLRHAPPNLAGKVYRLHVGGRNGHRLIYIYDPKVQIALPVFISEETKSNFDYESVPWGDIANRVFDDYVNKRYGSFRNWQR